MSVAEEILGQFLGDESFPVTWDSEVEQEFFWVYDDLHFPHPVSPMFFDIGGWWLSCDHMFRRFGTPFAVDWLAKNVNGYVYTTAIPADPDLRIDATEYSARYGARVPRDAAYATTMGKYLDTVLPVYGEHFADWWRDRLRPEMERNFAYLEGRLDEADRMSLAEVACLLEDAIDIHDRHWKIHWMLNFAQLSATLNLRAVMEKTRGERGRAAPRPAPELRLGPQLGLDRDPVEDEERGPRRRPAAGRLRRHRAARDRRGAPRASERGRRFIAERVEPYQREFGWHAVWSHEFIFPTAREEMEPVLELVRGYLDTDYDYPAAIDAMRRDIEAASAEILEGLTGDALEEMRAANAVNLRMAPLTPDHHFYIDQGANAHVRLVLIAIGRKLVEAGRLDQPDDVMFLRYNELRALIGDASAIEARAIVAARRAERAASEALRPRDWVGTATPSQLAFPYLVNWGYPERFHQQQSADVRSITGLGASPGILEGIARVVRTVDEFDEVRDGDILVCQMTNPAWVVLFTKIAGLVTDTGGTTSHPAVLAREFGIPAVIGTSVATHRISTGDRLRIDGTAGTVEILSAAPGAGCRARPAPRSERDGTA